MKETYLKKLCSISIVITLSSMIWAVGANSRKRVELEKSSSLDTQVEKLTQSNTVLTEDLKKTHNELAQTKRTLHALKETVATEELKNQSLRTKLEETQKQNERFAEELETLRKTNQTLNDELTELKEQYSMTQKESEKKQINKTKKTPDTSQPKESSKEISDKINWNW